jgi:hypothetical protein
MGILSETDTVVEVGPEWAKRIRSCQVFDKTLMLRYRLGYNEITVADANTIEELYRQGYKRVVLEEDAKKG